MEPIPELVGIRRSSCLEFFHYFFACFSILRCFTFLSQITSQKGAKKSQKSWQSTKKPPPDLAWKPYLQKASPKCENRIPFNVLSLFPRVPGTPKSIANWIPNGPRNCNLWAKWAPKKTTKNKPLKTHQKQQNSLKLDTPGATKVQPICNFFAPFCTPGPKWARSRPGLQKKSPEASKRYQKAPKR